MSDSHTITRLRLPLAFCIILIHLNMGVSGTQIGWGSLSTLDVWRIFACVSINELAAIAVPLFFLISGFLFFYHAEWSAATWLAKMRRRVRSLLVPYVLFCLLAVVSLIINNVQDGHTLSQALHAHLADGKWLHNFWDIHTTGHNTNLLGITKPISYPVVIPLWFIRDLMVIVLMTPLIHWAIRRLRLGWIAIMLALSLTGVWIPLVGFSPTSCLYFSIGAWFSISGKSMADGLQHWRSPLLMAALPLLALDILADGTAADRYVHFIFLLMAVPATYALAAPKQLVPQGSKFQVPSSKFKVPSFNFLLPTGASDSPSKIEGVDAEPARQTGAYDEFSNFKSQISNTQSVSSLSFFIFAFHTLPIPLLGCRPVEWAKQLLWTNSSNGILCIVQFVGTAFLTAMVCVLVWGLLYWLCPGLLGLLTGRLSRR